MHPPPPYNKPYASSVHDIAKYLLYIHMKLIMYLNIMRKYASYFWYYVGQYMSSVYSNCFVGNKIWKNACIHVWYYFKLQRTYVRPAGSPFVPLVHPPPQVHQYYICNIYIIFAKHNFKFHILLLHSCFYPSARSIYHGERFMKRLVNVFHLAIPVCFQRIRCKDFISF